MIKTFFKECWTGIKAYHDAHKLIRKNRWWGFVILPGILHLALLVLIFILAWIFSDAILDYFLQLFGVAEEVNDLSFLKITLRILLIWVIRILLITLYLAAYKHLVLIILAPVLAYLSEKTEAKITGRTYPFRFKKFLKDVLRGILIALRNLVIEVGWMVLLYLLAFIPIIGLVSPVLLFFIESYFYGFSMIDYYLERQRMSVKASVRFVRKHKGVAIGNGAAFFGLVLVPVVGWMIAPVYSVIAGTIAVHKIETPDG